MELPRRYLDISANPNDPFIGAVLFLSVFGLSLTLFVVVGLSSMETKLWELTTEVCAVWF